MGLLCYISTIPPTDTIVCETIHGVESNQRQDVCRVGVGIVPSRGEPRNPIATPRNGNNWN